jgi:membrane-bound lytic murein transglycosylase B
MLALATAQQPTPPATTVRPIAATTPAAPAAAPLAPPSPDLPGLPPVSTQLAHVAVDSPALRKARTEYDAAAAALAERQGQRIMLALQRSDLEARSARLDTERAAALARAEGARARLDEVDGALSELAVNLFVTGGAERRIDAALTAEQPSVNDEDRRQVLGAASLDVLLAERAAYQARFEEATARAEATAAELGDVRTELARLTEAAPAAVEAEVAAAPAVATERVAYERARALARVDGVDFPLVALDAYHRAAGSIGLFEPACGVQWWAIAGISRVEGQHGTFGGAELDVLGNPTKLIIGIQLNGTNNTAVVGDSDGGALDGDPAFDRAVGPMQFIPQTWFRWAADGNGDGVATPFNLYDATLATARYLCASSGGLASDDGLRQAYFSYNHSLEYVERVLSFARGYERSLDLADRGN